MRTGPTAVKHRGLAPEEQPARRTALLQHPACASTYGRRHEHAHWSSRSDVSEISGIPLPAVISEVVGEQQQLIPQYTAEQDHRCLSVCLPLSRSGRSCGTRRYSSCRFNGQLKKSCSTSSSSAPSHSCSGSKKGTAAQVTPRSHDLQCKWIFPK